MTITIQAAVPFRRLHLVNRFRNTQGVLDPRAGTRVKGKRTVVTGGYLPAPETQRRVFVHCASGRTSIMAHGDERTAKLDSPTGAKGNCMAAIPCNWVADQPLGTKWLAVASIDGRLVCWTQQEEPKVGTVVGPDPMHDVPNAGVDCDTHGIPGLDECFTGASDALCPTYSHGPSTCAARYQWLSAKGHMPTAERDARCGAAEGMTFSVKGDSAHWFLAGIAPDGSTFAATGKDTEAEGYAPPQPRPSTPDPAPRPEPKQQSRIVVEKPPVPVVERENDKNKANPAHLWTVWAWDGTKVTYEVRPYRSKRTAQDNANKYAIWLKQHVHGSECGAVHGTGPEVLGAIASKYAA